jgi:hypothetical protein
MQLARYCPALPRTARPALEPAPAKGASAAACRYRGAASGRDYVVAALGGDDAGPGALAAPFATLARAVTASLTTGGEAI